MCEPSRTMVNADMVSVEPYAVLAGQGLIGLRIHGPSIKTTIGDIWGVFPAACRF